MADGLILLTDDGTGPAMLPHEDIANVVCGEPHPIRRAVRNVPPGDRIIGAVWTAVAADTQGQVALAQKIATATPSSAGQIIYDGEIGGIGIVELVPDGADTARFNALAYWDMRVQLQNAGWRTVLRGTIKGEPGLSLSALPVGTQIAASIDFAGGATGNLAEGGTLQLVPTVRDSAGIALSPQPALAWSVASGAGATTNQTGLVTADAGAFQGQVVIRAELASDASIGATVTLTLVADTVPASVAFTNARPVSLADGATLQATVAVKNARNRTLSGVAVTYDAPDASDVSVSSGGLITGAYADGQASVRVRVTSNLSLADTLPITVTPVVTGAAADLAMQAAAIAALGTGWSVTDFWDMRSGTTGLDSAVGPWTGQNGGVLTPRGTVTRNGDGSLRGAFETTADPKWDPTGAVWLVVRNAKAGRTIANNGVGLGWESDAGHGTREVALLTEDQNSHGVWVDGAQNAATTPAAESAQGERCADLVLFEHTSGKVCLNANEESSFRAAIGGTALPSGASWKFMVNAGKIVGAVANSDQDVRAVMCLRGPAFASVADTVARFRAAVAPIMETWLTARHPLAARTRGRITALGDSLTAAGGTYGTFGLVHTWAEQLATAYPQHDWRNLALGGAKLGLDLAGGGDPLADLRAKYDNELRVFSERNPKRPFEKLVIFAGTNDGAQGTTAAQVGADYRAIIAQAIAAGYAPADIVLVKMLDRANLQTFKNALHAQLDQIAVDTGVKLAGTDPRIHADGACNDVYNASTNPTGLSADTTHLTTPGQAILAPLIEAKLFNLAAPVLTSLDLQPASFSVAPGATFQLAATPRDQNGNAMTGFTVLWQSSDATKASVSASGLVTGVATGAATITATVQGFPAITDTSAGTVSAPLTADQQMRASAVQVLGGGAAFDHFWSFDDSTGPDAAVTGVTAQVGGVDLVPVAGHTVARQVDGSLRGPMQAAITTKVTDGLLLFVVRNARAGRADASFGQIAGLESSGGRHVAIAASLGSNYGVWVDGAANLALGDYDGGDTSNGERQIVLVYFPPGTGRGLYQVNRESNLEAALGGSAFSNADTWTFYLNAGNLLGSGMGFENSDVRAAGIVKVPASSMKKVLDSFAPIVDTWMAARHPLAARTQSRIKVLGDESSVTQGGVTSWPTLYGTDRASWDVRNFSIDSGHIGTPLASGGIENLDLEATTDARFRIFWTRNSKRPRDIIIWSAGMGDMLSAGLSAAATGTLLSNAIQRELAAGYPAGDIYLIKPLSHSGANGDLRKNEFSAQIDTIASTLGVHVVGTDPLLHGDGAYANATYFASDRLTAAGMQKLRDLVEAAIAA